MNTERYGAQVPAVGASRYIRPRSAHILCHLKQQTGIRFYTAISTLADQTEQAAAAYTDALRALSYHIYERENDVYDDTMVCHQKPSFSPSSIAYDPMITCIEHNDPDEIKRCCAQFVHSLSFLHNCLRLILSAACVFTY